ncbi:phage tail protein [Streptomyces olivoreticuli]
MAPYSSSVAPAWSFHVHFLFRREPLIGIFTSCNGIGYEIVHEDYNEGGNNDYTWRFPSKVRYTNLTLTRPVTRSDSFFLQLWMWQQLELPTQGKDLLSSLLSEMCFIKCFSQSGDKVVTWVLEDAIPVRLSSPSFAVGESSVAEETLEIAYSGVSSLPF